jgi:hypothetical protein
MKRVPLLPDEEEPSECLDPSVPGLHRSRTVNSDRLRAGRTSTRRLLAAAARCSRIDLPPAF